MSFKNKKRSKRMKIESTSLKTVRTTRQIVNTSTSPKVKVAVQTNKKSNDSKKDSKSKE